jgi:hypothetical protein
MVEPALTQNNSENVVAIIWQNYKILDQIAKFIWSGPLSKLRQNSQVTPFKLQLLDGLSGVLAHRQRDQDFGSI